jgi:hypothetical protein
MTHNPCYSVDIPVHLGALVSLALVSNHQHPLCLGMAPLCYVSPSG